MHRLHGRSADKSLAEIHCELQQMNAQKESLKKLPGVTQTPASPQKRVR